jgi:hypothetical protein
MAKKKNGGIFPHFHCCREGIGLAASLKLWIWTKFLWRLTLSLSGAREFMGIQNRKQILNYALSSTIYHTTLLALFVLSLFNCKKKVNYVCCSKRVIPQLSRVTMGLQIGAYIWQT